MGTNLRSGAEHRNSDHRAERIGFFRSVYISSGCGVEDDGNNEELVGVPTFFLLPDGEGLYIHVDHFNCICTTAESKTDNDNTP